MSRLRVYISGPLSSSGDRAANVKREMGVAVELIKEGFAPLCPHLTHFLDETDSLGHGTWMEVDLPWVAVADCVLRLSGESKGADLECAEAVRLGIPVYLSVAELRANQNQSDWRCGNCHEKAVPGVPCSNCANTI